MTLVAIATHVTSALWKGVLLGLQYNPVFGIIGAVVAAAVLGYPKAPRERRFWAGAAIVVTWLVGDGLMIVGRTREAFDGLGSFAQMTPAWVVYILLAAWAVVAVCVGYIAPAWAGIIVGRRVTHGTGWLAAIAIAVGVSLGISSLIAGLGILG